MSYLRFYWALALFLLLFVPACGGKTVPVSGHLKFKDGSDSSALAGYEIALETTEGTKTSAGGQIAASGSFKVSTFGVEDGALPGKHRVAITPPASSDPDKPPPKSKLPAKYESFDTSGLTVEIKPGQKNVELELERIP
jgi:hypothetical protein